MRGLHTKPKLVSQPPSYESLTSRFEGIKNKIALVVGFFQSLYVSYEKLVSLCHSERPTFQQSVFHHSMLIHILYVTWPGK